MFKIFENAILCGDIDYYCLVCDYQMKHFGAAEAHIEEGSHKKKLTPFLSLFPGEHIRKFDKGYYCSFCNIIISTNNDVELHVLDLKHTQKKSSLQLERFKDFVVVFNEYVISENVWNGIIGQRCMVCNINFENNVLHHKLEVSHILNLIQKRVEFGVNKTVYRKIDNSSIHCLTCNAVIEIQTFKKHLNQDHRLTPKDEETKVTDITKHENQKSSKREDDGTCDLNVNDVPELDNHESPETVLKKVSNEILSSESNQQAVNMDTATSNIENDADKTKNEKSLASVPLENHTESDNLPEEIKDQKTDDHDSPKIRNPLDVLAEAKAFANENKLTYNWGKKNAYCRVCEETISSTYKNMKEHVAGKPHKSNIDKNSNLPIKSPAKTTSIMLRNVVVVEHDLTNKVFLNEVLCVDSVSFHTICKVGDFRSRCQACEVNLTKSEIVMHSKLITHARRIENIAIVSNFFPQEFVREIRQNVYHCGFCNQMESLGSLEDHFKCSVHKYLRNKYEECLKTHLPYLRLYKYMVGRSVRYFNGSPSYFDFLLLSGLLRDF